MIRARARPPRSAEELADRSEVGDLGGASWAVSWGAGEGAGSVRSRDAEDWARKVAAVGPCRHAPAAACGCGPCAAGLGRKGRASPAACLACPSWEPE